jgi:hypothetical protein
MKNLRGREIHGFMRTDRGEEEQKIREERAEQSRAFGRREKISEKMRKNGYLVTRIVELGIANRG